MPILLLCACSKDKRFAVSTLDATDIKATRMTLHGVAKEGLITEVEERGFCYDEVNIPTILDHKTTAEGFGGGDFSVTLKGLLPNHSYFVKAFSRLGDGTVYYGNLKQISTNGEYEIGDKGPAGGIVFQVNPDTKAEFRFAEEHLISGSYEWGCESTDIPNSSSSNTWMAKNNCTEILKLCNSGGTAVSVCNNLVFGGFSDWYLPTAADLHNLYLLKANGQLSYYPVSYWTCTQYDKDQGYQVSLADGIYRHSFKYSTFPVIAVRYFN